MTAHLILFLAQYGFVALKAFQQLNVVHHRIRAAVLTSFLMASFEVTALGAFVHEAAAARESGSLVQVALLIIPFGLGGGLGCVTSMMVHSRMRRA